MAEGKDSFKLEPKSLDTTTSTSIPQQHRPVFMASNILRFLAILLSAASIAVMVTNNQTVFIFGLKLEAHYYYTPSFKFFVAANAIVCGSSLLILITNWLILIKRWSKSQRSFFLFFHDIVMTVLLISGCAAATAIGYVGQYGDEHVGWQAICDQVRKFCRTNLVSLLLSYLAFFAYLVLTLLTAYSSNTLSSSSSSSA